MLIEKRKHNSFASFSEELDSLLMLSELAYGNMAKKKRVSRPVKKLEPTLGGGNKKYGDSFVQTKASENNNSTPGSKRKSSCSSSNKRKMNKTLTLVSSTSTSEKEKEKEKEKENENEKENEIEKEKEIEKENTNCVSDPTPDVNTPASLKEQEKSDDAILFKPGAAIVKIKNDTHKLLQKYKVAINTRKKQNISECDIERVLARKTKLQSHIAECEKQIEIYKHEVNALDKEIKHYDTAKNEISFLNRRMLELDRVYKSLLKEEKNSFGDILVQI